MKASLIITTKQEEASIGALLDSILIQSHLPDEVIIADASSTDQTRRIIHSYAKKLPIRLVEVASNANRSVGRNAAITAATYPIILITDAGCRLDSAWTSQMLSAMCKGKTDCVAGFYQGEAKNVFEQCMIPFVLVMPDRVDPSHFLPATRSMAIKKSVWEEMGGFDERLRFGEDYAFARRLEKKGYVIVAAPQAIVFWRPRPTLGKFGRMLYEHAFGDAYSLTWRPRVVLIYLRWILFVGTGMFGYALFVAYLLYAFQKNARYVGSWKAAIYLPILQVVADIAVMIGTANGLVGLPA